MSVAKSPRSSRSQEIFDLISAVAAGDASRQDVVSTLKDKGIDSLDVLIEVLARAVRASEHRSPRFLDPQQLANVGHKRAESAVHPVPDVPFIFRGVLYDPQDIHRFDDRDLHMIARGPGDPLVAIDDHALMVNWWQLSFLTSMTTTNKAQTLTLDGGTRGPGTEVPVGRGGGVVTSGNGAAAVSAGNGGDVGTRSSPEGFGGPPLELGVPPFTGNLHTNFYEHYNFAGDRFELDEGHLVNDLRDESTGFLGLGTDWNDRISSVQMIGTTLSILWDDVNEGGSSITLTQSMGGIPGWNDRASSIFTQ